ncbi:hypothetical protein [Methylocella sp.]|uniref:hypothetical protein n=1 Tax=Methylocella sp. TaxID=1978226 RepID=UPI003784AAB5
MAADYDDVKAVAHLPNLDIEIQHRAPRPGQGEVLTISLRATPSFEAAFRHFEDANPFAFWTRAIEDAWAPWLRLAGFDLPAPRPSRLPRRGER